MSANPMSVIIASLFVKKYIIFETWVKYSELDEIAGLNEKLARRKFWQVAQRLWINAPKVY